jgi:hypothetical protein
MSRYIAIYYSDAWFKDQNLFTSCQLFFDELHIVLPIDVQTDMNDYVKKFKVPYQLHVIGIEDESSRIQIAQFKKGIDFALKNRALVGECLFYHSHIVNSKIHEMTRKLHQGGLPKDELYSFITGTDEDSRIIKEFFDLIRDPSEEWLAKVSSTAYVYSKKYDWQLISDDEAFPIPTFSRRNLQVKQLTSVLAEKCFEVAVPQCRAVEAEELLELRRKLSEVLIPYRMALQRLSAKLRSGLEEQVSIADIKKEAKFLAESEIEPAVYELRQRIEKNLNGIILKVFGKIVGWIPIVATAFLAPTPDRIYEALKKAYADVGDLAGIGYDQLRRDPSLSFLISANKMLSLQKS